MNRRGVELSMNLIIISAIGLLVLVILCVLIINKVNPPSPVNVTESDPMFNVSNDSIDNSSFRISNESLWSYALVERDESSNNWVLMNNSSDLLILSNNFTRLIIDASLWREVSCNETVEINHSRCFVR